MIARWPAPTGEEYALAIDRGRAARLLVIPALFDEGNKLRRFTAETMRHLDAREIDCILPDLPGCHESLALLASQSLARWREAMTAAAAHFRATHVLSVRGGCLCAPEGLPLGQYAPVTGDALLRTMLRAHVLGEREAGRETSREAALALGREQGIRIGGYALSAQLVSELNAAVPPECPCLIRQADLGGAGLWTRTEPSEDAAQACALAKRAAAWIG